MAYSGDSIADLLTAGGVRRFYTVPGESFLEIMDGVERHRELELISTRHEGGAVFMADADAKMTGRPAVVAATRAVGGANLAIGVHTALQDSTPMVVMLGQVETGFLGREAFQEVDVPAFFGPISKLALTVQRTDRIPELVAKALRVATTGRPGPVVLAFPADVLEGEVSESNLAGALRRLGGRTSPPAPDPRAVDRLASALRSAERPVILAGGGARGARAALEAVADKFDLGVYAAFRRQDVFDNGHRRYLGHVGLGSHPRVVDGLRSADLVLVVGCRLSEISSAGYTIPDDESQVAHIDIDSAVIGSVSPAEIGIVSDAEAALSALLERAADATSRDWTGPRAVYEELSAVGSSRASTGCDPAQVVAALKRTFPEDTVIANDAGNFSAFLHRHWPYRHPLSSVGVANGAMGYGVPAGIGAKIAAPNRTVMGMAGDGGFLMTGLELETAVRYGIGVKIVVLRNGLHGTIAMHQARDTGRLVGTDIGPVDIAGVARALGAEAWTVRAEDDLDAVLRESFVATGPTLVEVLTDPELIDPDNSLSDLLPSHLGAG